MGMGVGEMGCRPKRLLFTGLAAGLALAVLAGRLAWIQLAAGPRLAALALAEVSRAVPLEAVPRGDIEDDHLVPLTGAYQADRLVVFPDLLAHPARDAAALAPLLSVSATVLARDLAGGPKVLAYPVDPVVRRAVAGLNDPGLSVHRVAFRNGPGALAVHLTGYLGPPENRAQAARILPGGPDLVGLCGLEACYDRDLQDNIPRRAVREFLDADGRPTGIVAVNQSDADPARRNLVLTIDSRVQAAVERIMDQHVRKGAVVVLDAATGDVLAMASRPTFQPDRITAGLGSSADVFENRALALYPPGSVFKVVVAAAALDQGVVTPGTMFFDRGARATPVPDWYGPGFGLINFDEAFAESVNPFFAKIGLQLGAARLIDYAKRFGLAVQSPAGYPLPPDGRQNWSLVAARHCLADSSIGQGPVLVSPLQVAGMVETVVNGGVYVQPRLVKAVVDDDGRVVMTPSRLRRRAIGPAADRELLAVMRLVTTSGTGRDAQVPGWGSAGKTGTAQTGNPDSPDDAWFAGFAPWPRPRYVAVVLVQGGTDGGTDAGGVFKLLMEKLLNGTARASIPR